MLRTVIIALLMAGSPALTWGQTAASDVQGASSQMAACAGAGWNPDEDDYGGACIMALGFDPSVYFYPDEGDPPDPLEPRSIVEAIYVPSLRSVAWAFAIDFQCADPDACLNNRGHVVLRAVRWKTRKEMPPDWREEPLRSKVDVQHLLSSATKWQEADLGTCPGASKLLRNLETVRWMEFGDVARRRIYGMPDPRELIVSTDGDTVIVKAGDYNHATASRDKGDKGTPGAWAEKMMDVVEPCLRLSSSTPPWER